MIRPLLRLAAIGACALAVSGCSISLLPKGKVAQLYRFGALPAAASKPAKPNAVAVFRANGSFQGESADDRILTITGGKAAYIAESRWVAPAETLFNEALVNAFDGSPVRLIARGQFGRPAYSLRTDVRTFEVRYDSGSSAAPTVVVRLHAALTKADATNAGEQDFESRVPATDNRVGEIVAAYNKAVADVVGKLVAWTETVAT
jgi:cholesterol transport system auxiliary component